MNMIMIILNGGALVALTALAAAIYSGPAAYYFFARWSARLALLLFMVAFAAGPLQRRWHVALTQALLRRRRHVGLSSAWFMLCHFVCLALLFIAWPALLKTHVNSANLSAAVGLALAMGWMSASSNKAAIKRLGFKRWRSTHRVAGYVILVLFTLALVPHWHSPGHWLLLTPLVVLWCVRLLPPAQHQPPDEARP